MASGHVTIDNVQCIGETPSGALVCMIDGEKVFIPSKLVHDDSECYKSDTEGTLVIPEWLAEEKELG